MQKIELDLIFTLLVSIAVFLISKATALRGVTIQLHPGAARYLGQPAPRPYRGVEPGEDTYDGTVIEAQYRPALLAGAVAASASPVFAQHSVSLEARIADYVAIFAHSFVPIGERRKKGRES